MSLQDLLEQAKESKSAEIEQRRIKATIAQKEKHISSLIGNYYNQQKATLEQFKIAFPFFTHSSSSVSVRVEQGGKYSADDTPRYASVWVHVNQDKLFFKHSLGIRKAKVIGNEGKYNHEELNFSTLPFNATDEEIVADFNKTLEVAIRNCLEL